MVNGLAYLVWTRVLSIKNERVALFYRSPPGVVSGHLDDDPNALSESTAVDSSGVGKTCKC